MEQNYLPRCFNSTCFERIFFVGFACLILSVIPSALREHLQLIIVQLLLAAYCLNVFYQEQLGQFRQCGNHTTSKFRSTCLTDTCSSYTVRFAQCMHVYVDVCVCVCVYIYIYIYTHTHTHTHTPAHRAFHNVLRDSKHL